MPPIAVAGPEDLDRTFGKKGRTYTKVGSTGAGAARVAFLPNGDIVAAGVMFTGLGEDTDSDFALVGYTAQGRVDHGFGDGGRVAFDFGEEYVWETPSDLAVQTDGKILVGGDTAAAGAGGGAALGVARFNPDGSFDSTLAGDGTLAANPEGMTNAAAVLPVADGGFYVAGPTEQNQDVAIARFDPDGSLDAGFAGDGVATTDLGLKESVFHAVLQEDRKIVVVVHSDALGEDEFGLLRFDPDGSLDDSFGNNGIASAAGPAVTELALTSEGELVAAGGRVVARFRADGEPDRSFSRDGTFSFPRRKGFSANALALQPNGAAVVAGTSRRRDKSYFAVARIRPTGKLDRGFSNDGVARVDLGSRDAALGVALQANGKIVAAGRARGRNLFIGGVAGRDSRFAIARFKSG